MIPEELQENEYVQKLVGEYTSGDIRFDEFEDRLDFIVENGYDREDKPGKALLNEITEEINNYEKDNIPSGREHIVISYSQYRKIVEERMILGQSETDGIVLFGYDVELDDNAENTPKLVESNKYEYEHHEFDEPVFDGQSVF